MSSPAGPPAIELSAVLHMLQGSGLYLASSSMNRSVTPTSPTLFDALSSAAEPRKGILLGIGLHPAAADTAQVVRSAAAQGFEAIVIKSWGLPVAELAGVADDVGIALIAIDQDVEWRKLDSLLSVAITAASETEQSISATPLGDLFALANAIAALTGGATAIEDLHERVLAYSTLPGQPIDDDRRQGILGRQVPDLPENDEQYAALYRDHGTIRVPGVPPSLGRLAIAVRAGSQPLGSIWVVDATGELDADAVTSLERAAEIAALHLLRARSAADLVKHQRADLLRRVLDGGEGSRLAASQLGLEPSGPLVVAAFQAELGQAANAARMSRFADLVAIQCEIHAPGTECIVEGNTVYALFTGAASADYVGIETMAHRLIERAAAALGLRALGAVGSMCHALTEIGRSRRDADMVLLLLGANLNAGQVSTARGTRSQLSLLELAEAFRQTPRLRSQQAIEMLDSDARSGTEYARTVRAYFAAGRDIAATARLLDVHTNTVRYRVRRAGDVFDIDFDDPDDSLIIWLTLRLSDFD